VLLERARAPGAARREVDALLRGLALPLPPGEDARARADLLHDLLEDRRVRAFTGSNGRRVAHAAVDALEALGYPYALEIPPELLAEARAARPAPAPAPTPALPARPPPSGFRLLGWILFTMGVLIGSAYYLLYLTGPLSLSGAMASLLVISPVGAALVASHPPVVRRRGLHWLLLLLAGAPGLVNLRVYLPLLFEADWNPLVIVSVGIPLVAGVFQVVGALCLYCPPPDEEWSAPEA
jgi:hypothetical protein